MRSDNQDEKGAGGRLMKGRAQADRSSATPGGSRFPRVSTCMECGAAGRIGFFDWRRISACLADTLHDELLLRGSRDFEDLATYRRFVDEVVGPRNARNRKRIEIERIALRKLSDRRTTDYEEARVLVMSSGGFIQRVVYSVPSGLMATGSMSASTTIASIASSAPHLS
jgi:hypothetical protein